MFKNLFKAAVGVITTPIAIAVDTITFMSDVSNDGESFHRTSKNLKTIKQNVDKALDPEE